MNLHKKNQKHHINSFKSDQLTKYLSSEIFVTISDFNDAWLHVKQYHIENDKYYVDQIRNDTKINCIYSNDYDKCCDSYKRNYNNMNITSVKDNNSTTEEIVLQQKLDGIHEYIFHGSSNKFGVDQTTIVTTEDAIDVQSKEPSKISTRSVLSSLGSVATTIGRLTINDNDWDDEQLETKQDPQLETNEDTPMIVPPLKQQESSKFLTEVTKLSQYSFGYQFRYTMNHQYDAWFVRPYYDNIKEEILAHASMSMDKWRLHQHKVSICHDMRNIKAMTAIWYLDLNRHYGINAGDILQDKHILSCIIYSSCSEYCTDFRSSYRMITENESDDSIKDRHSKFVHTAKSLYEAYTFFAGTRENIVLYHGISGRVLFKTLYCTFNAPTSTSTRLEVAESFCNKDGVVIRLSSCDSSQAIKCLNMSLFSDYQNENEYLIFETRASIRGISIGLNGKWIQSKHLSILSLYDLLIHGQPICRKILLKKQGSLYKLLNQIQKTNNLNNTDNYVEDLIVSFISNNRKIWINPKIINDQLTSRKLKELFVDNKCKFGVFIRYLQNTHNATIYPIFTSEWRITQTSLLYQERYIRNKVICHGSYIICDLLDNDNKLIIFRPMIIKNYEEIDFQLVLISKPIIFKDESVRLSFILECAEHGFYRFLYPKALNTLTEYDNKYRFKLPSEFKFDRDLTIKLSLMIENIEKFDVSVIDYQQLPPSALMVEDIPEPLGNITKTLSFIFGSTNSFLSVIDTVSDIWFSIRIFQYTNLVILLWFNLFAMAIITVCYFMYKIRRKHYSYCYIVFISPFLLLFSPILGCMEWFATQFHPKCVPQWLIQDDVTNELISEEDSFLVWVKSEIKRNEFFLIELVIKSLWQIIFQFSIVIHLGLYDTKDVIIVTVSIFISFLVIVSKLILLSYSPNKLVIIFNLLLYLLDISFYFLWSIFFFFGTASIWEQQSVSQIDSNWAYYMGFAALSLLFISTLFGLTLASIFSKNWLMAFIIFILSYIITIFPAFVYGIALWSFFPILHNLAYNPYHFGKYYIFHKKLYKFITNDISKENYDFVMVCVNYLLCKEYYDYYFDQNHRETNSNHSDISSNSSLRSWKKRGLCPYFCQFCCTKYNSFKKSVNYSVLCNRQSQEFMKWIISKESNLHQVSMKNIHFQCMDPWNNIIGLIMNRYKISKLNPKLYWINLKILFCLKNLTIIGWFGFYIFAIAFTIMHYMEAQENVEWRYFVLLIGLSMLLMLICLIMYCSSIKKWNTYADDMIAFQNNLYVPWLRYENFIVKLQSLIDYSDNKRKKVRHYHSTQAYNPINTEDEEEKEDSAIDTFMICTPKSD